MNDTEVVTIPLAGSSDVHSNNSKETVLASHLSITSLELWATEIPNLIPFPAHGLRCLMHILINNFSSDFQQIFPPQLQCMGVCWGKGCQRPLRPPQERGKHQGRFASISPTTSFSLLKGRGAMRAQHQLLTSNKDLPFVFLARTPVCRQKRCTAGTLRDFCGACCRSTPGHEGQFSTAAMKRNEKSRE